MKVGKIVKIGERIRALRLDAGMTQEELAQRIGLKKQNISRYENSRVEPNIRTAKRIAEALGVSLEEMAVGVTVSETPISSVLEQFSSAAILTEDEQELLAKYQQLTELNKGRVLQQIDTLIESQKQSEAKSINFVG